MTHPTDGYLMDYAAGALPAGMSLLVACHLTLCPACRDRVARYETVGGALLSEPVRDDLVPPDLAEMLARIEALEASPPAPVAEPADPVLPEPLRRVLGCGSDAIRWRRLLPGLAEQRLEGFPGEDVRLVRARPGTRILLHTHEGDEATLVLKGALQDEDRVFRRGEVSLAGPEHNHQPRIIGDTDCICLAVFSGRMRFTGPFGRILNLLGA